jgi:hypothetical protein
MTDDMALAPMLLAGAAEDDHTEAPTTWWMMQELMPHALPRPTRVPLTVGADASTEMVAMMLA